MNIEIHTTNDQITFRNNPTYRIDDGLLFIIGTKGNIVAVFKEYVWFRYTDK